MKTPKLAQATILLRYSLENCKKIVQNYLCLESNAPCNICHACNLIAVDNHPDFLILAPEIGKKSIGIDQIRTAQIWVATKPIIGSLKFLLIDNANLLQTAASNAMLKLLEEPPEYLKCMLIATDISEILPTILSRCQVWRNHDILPDNFENILQQYSTSFDAILAKHQSPIELAAKLKELPLQQTCDAIYVWLANYIKLNTIPHQVTNLLQFILQQKSILQNGVPLNAQLLLETILLEISVINNKELTYAIN